MTPSQRARKPKRNPRKQPGSHYTTGSYLQAIKRACRLAFPHPTLAPVRPKELTEGQRAELAAWDRAHAWHVIAGGKT